MFPHLTDAKRAAALARRKGCSLTQEKNIKLPNKSLEHKVRPEKKKTKHSVTSNQESTEAKSNFMKRILHRNQIIKDEKKNEARKFGRCKCIYCWAPVVTLALMKK